MPTVTGIPTSYEQKAFAPGELAGKLRLVASPDGRKGSVTIHTDACIYAGVFDSDSTGELPLAPDRYGWVHIARGRAQVNGKRLVTGDGATL